MESKVYDLFMPWNSLDDWQKQYIETEPDTSCFLLTGRQVGKTTAMSIKSVELCVHHFKRGQNILICSITEKQAQRMLSKALAYAKIKYPKILIQKGKDKPTMHRLSFTTGAGIYCYAAGETGEGLRGDTIKKLMIDEGSRMSEEFFIATIPMLSVSKGSLDIASTPCGKTGYFYDCSKDESFKKFYVSAEDCPRHTKEFLDREKKRMSRLSYAQEYLAQFLDELRRVFPEELLKKCFVKTIPSIHTCKFLGVDVARYGKDKNAFIVDEYDNLMKEHFITRAETSEQQSISETYKKIIEMNERTYFNKILIDDAGIGGGLADFLIEKLKNKIVTLNNASRSITHDKTQKKRILKEDLYSFAVIKMEQGKVKILENSEIYLSLASMQYEYDDEDVRIYGKDSHIAEAFVRAIWGEKLKSARFFMKGF